MHAGIDRSWDVLARELFSLEFANSIYQATMSIFTFKEIGGFARFDDIRTWEVRFKTEKFAMVSYIWNQFLQQYRNCIVPDINVTIDEQLIAIRGRCGLAQYMS